MSSKTDGAKKLPPGVRPEDLVPDPNMSEEEHAKRKRFAAKFKALQGKLKLNLDVDELRGRNRS